MTPDKVNESSSTPGRVRSFLFEQLDIRGVWVQLDQTWRDMIAGRDYAPATTTLLGEMAAVTALLAANLKQAGRLTFQLRGEGAVKRLVMICNEQMQLRGMAREAMERGLWTAAWTAYRHALSVPTFGKTREECQAIQARVESAFEALTKLAGS